MTKKEIAQRISETLTTEDFKLTQLKAKEIVQMTLDAIIEALLTTKNNRIELRKFGVFSVKRRKARHARNPQNEGETVYVPPKNVVVFKPGKEMEEKVRNLTNIPLLDEEKEAMAKAEQNGTSKKKRKPSPKKSKSS